MHGIWREFTLLDPTRQPYDARTVSVLMPLRNEAAFIERSLGAILIQDYPHSQIEVIIADGMSNDGTHELISQMKATSDVDVAVYDNPERIVAKGLNIALSHAKGDVIIRVDGHTIVASDYVSRCVAALHRSGAGNVGGCMTAVGEGWMGKAIAVATSTPFGVGGARFHYSDREQLVDTVYMWQEIVSYRYSVRQHIAAVQ